MTGNKPGSARAVLLLLVLILAAQGCRTALAGDMETLRRLPGRWAEEYEGAGTVLTIEEDGRISLYCYSTEEDYAYTCGGTWMFEYRPDMNDRLTLTFTSTDNPAYADGEYRAECVYEAYTESWVENDTLIRCLILTPAGGSGGSPFEDVYGNEGGEVALYTEKGPNMRIANCKDYVSLRAERSKTSKRLAKVPLGALVLAFPEEGTAGGFISCVYQDIEGYILTQYLEPVEQE